MVIIEDDESQWTVVDNAMMVDTCGLEQCLNPNGILRFST
jgi:hypothetical protein